MAGFPKLIPAFSAQIVLTEPSQVGSVARGSGLVHVGFQPTGYLRSEPEYPVSVDAVFVHGADYLRLDPDGKHIRLEVSSVLKDSKSGSVIRYDYTGTIDMGGPAGKVLRDEKDAKTTDFGEAFTHVKFETGTEELRALEHKVYVASGRFIVEEGKPLVVEYKISEVSN